MAEQLSFNLPAKPALGREDFFVAPSNTMAVSMIDATGSWPSGKLVLSGPAGSGKSHLAHVWAQQSGAAIVNARDLPGADLSELSRRPLVVEDIPQIATDDAAQTALFHLHNMVLANGQALLMTGRLTPNLWALTLPDLQSRVDGAAHVALEAPDDTLLAVVLAKLFNDRQIAPRPDVIPYLIKHMDRSFQAAAEIVERLDRMSLAESRNLSRALAVRLLRSAETAVEDAAPVQD